MKSLLMILMLATAPVLAANPYGDDAGAEAPVDYASWCEDNKVVGQNQHGNPVILQDCGKAGFVCKPTQMYRLHRYIMTATCAPAAN